MSVDAMLDAVMAKAITDDRIVGSVVIVSQHGRTLYEKAMGLADREAGRAMEIDAVFRLSSLTKPIVATAILAMVDAGGLRLTDQVADHLPYFRPALADGRVPDITIHHLLTHTSGIDSAGFDNSVGEEAAGINRWHHDNDAMMRRLAGLPLMFEPGSAWSYGTSIDVLGVIAAKVVGGSVDDALIKYVTGPLGMVDTRFAVTDRTRLSAAYGNGPAGTELMGDPHTVEAPRGGKAGYDPGRIFDRRAFQSGGGGMAGTGRDFMILLEALRTGTLLRPETADAGFSDQTPQLAHAQQPGWKFGYFGAWLDDPALVSSPARRGTVRWGGIYGHNWFVDRENGLSVVSMSNTGLEGCDGPYRDEVCAAVYAGLTR